jgi:demethoxyubiquinone hydroxylase (CLK1/Coq7/Cat5 family)
MKHLLVKFNHGVEIGAYMAYRGHYRRTKDNKVHMISHDELEHRATLKRLLAFYGCKPSWIINGFFWIVGSLIYVACQVSPRFMLDFIARVMEVFAVFSYTKLAIRYPGNSVSFLKMAETEKDHQEYFTLGPCKYQELQSLRASLMAGTFGKVVPSVRS